MVDNFPTNGEKAAYKRNSQHFQPGFQQVESAGTVYSLYNGRPGGKKREKPPGKNGFGMANSSRVCYTNFEYL